MNTIVKNMDDFIQTIDKRLYIELDKDIDKIQNHILDKLKATRDLGKITNNYSLNILEPIISNHIYFFRNSLENKDTKAIFQHLLWELSTYNKMGIEFKFYLYLFKYIVSSLEEQNNSIYNPLIYLYRLKIDYFEDIVNSAQSFKSKEVQSEHNNIYNSFIDSLLEPNITKAISVSNRFVQHNDDIKVFWEDIILPALYNIGIKWSNGEISVGQEHTATSICQRVMSLHYEKILEQTQNKKKVLVTVSPRELHHIGAVMISDLLELNGYNVVFLESGVDVDRIVDIINKDKIKDIVVSTTLISNIDSTNSLVNELIKNFQHGELNFYLGGQAYKTSLKLFKGTQNIRYIFDTDGLLKALEEV